MWNTSHYSASPSCASVPPLGIGRVEIATILPRSMLVHTAICLAEERQQICQTNYRTTVIAPRLLPGYRRLGVGVRR